MSAARLPLLALLTAVAAAAPAAAGPSDPGTFVEVPRPVLDSLENTMRQPVVAERAELDRLLAEGASPEELMEAFGRMGKLYYVHDFAAPAVACFTNALKLAPQDFRWHYFLGVLYPAEGELELAETHLRKAVALGPDDVPARARLGQVLLDLGRLEEAREQFDAVLALEPEHAAARFGLGRIALEGEDYDRAIADFERALELQPDATRIHYLLGLAFRAKGELERAKTEMLKNRHGDIKFKDPLVDELYKLLQSAKLHFDAAIDLLAEKKIELGIIQLRIALEIEPDNFLYRHNLASALVLAGHDEEGIAEYLRTLELNPNFRNSHFNLAVVLARTGRLEEAAEHFERAHRLDPDDQLTHVEWATALGRLGQTERAAEELERVLKLNPRNADALLNLSTLESARGRFAEAEAALGRLLEIEPAVPQQAVAHVRMGRLAERRRDDATAGGHFRSALEMDPGSKEAHLGLAGVLGRGGAFEEAALHLGAAAAADPADPGPLFGQGLALMLAEKYVQARATLETGLERHPRDLRLAHLLSRLLAAAPDDSVRDGERALELARRVFTAEQSIDHAETVAMALAELGRFAEAVEWQSGLLAEAQRQGGSRPLEPLRRRLLLYQEGRPCRAPWRDA